MVTHKDTKLHYISLTAIIHKDGKYLITKRSDDEKAFPGLWTVPGGKVEVVDYLNTPKTTKDVWYGALANTLIREVKEEVDLEIANIRFIIDMVFIRPDGIPGVILSFLANYKSGKVNLNKESVDFAWVTAKQANSYNLIEGIYEEILMADKMIRGADIGKLKFKIIKK